MNLGGLMTSQLLCYFTDNPCGPLQRTCKSAVTLGRMLYLSFAPFFQSVEWETNILPFIGKVLMGEKVQVSYLYLKFSLGFCYVCLPKILENAVDFLKINF